MTNTDVVTTTAPKHPIVVLRERLEARRDELKNSLPSDIQVDRFIRALITSAQLNTDILACNWQSLWLACMRACRDGLLPDGREGALVPFKGVASWIPMYGGLLKRFRRSGQFRWIKADVVRQGEEFYHYVDEHGEHIKHAPGDSFEAPIVKIYAMATTKDGGIFVTVLTIAEANKIKVMSKATREDSPWKMWPEEMLKKTALRRLSKVLPSEGDMIDDDLDLYDAPAIAPRMPADTVALEQLPRGSGAVAALDQFAGQTNDSAAAASDSVVRSGGEQTGGSGESASPAAPGSDGKPSTAKPK